MADWTNLPNQAVGVGGLPSGTTVTALRDNPIAIAEGAAGAPRANGKMAATLLEYATSNPLTGLLAGNLFLDPGLFDDYTFSDTNTSSSSFQSAGSCEITSRATGTMRFRATQNARQLAIGSVGSVIRLLKNSVVVETFSLSPPSEGERTQTRFVDVSAAVGDVFEWEVRRTGSSATISITDISVTADDTYTTQPLQLKVSEVRP